MPDAKQIEKALFEAARNLKDAQAREVLLNRACHDDPSLRARLERLLAAPKGNSLRSLRDRAILETESPRVGKR